MDADVKKWWNIDTSCKLAPAKEYMYQDADGLWKRIEGKWNEAGDRPIDYE